MERCEECNLQAGRIRNQPIKNITKYIDVKTCKASVDEVDENDGEKETGQAEGDNCLSGFLLIQRYKNIIRIH
jgi:hypothetical protein